MCDYLSMLGLQLNHVSKRGHCLSYHNKITQTSSWTSTEMVMNIILLEYSAPRHYIDVIMTKMASQITSLKVVYSAFYSNTDQRKHQSSASLAFVWGSHRDRWIPHTNGQLRGKCFRLMTSSWNQKGEVTMYIVSSVKMFAYIGVTIIDSSESILVNKKVYPKPL